MMWRVISDHALHLRSWGNEFVVYNSLSGDTHLLGSTAASVLSALQQAPSDAVTLAKSLAAMLKTEMDEAFTLQVDQLLAELDTLSLIERT